MLAFNRYHPWEDPELIDWDDDYRRYGSPRCLPVAVVGVAAIGAVALCRPSRNCRPRFFCFPRRDLEPRIPCYPNSCYPYVSCTPTHVCHPM